MAREPSPVKQHVKKFVQTELETDYKFAINLFKPDKEKEAEDFIKAMRVQLSRIREEVRDLGHVVIPFKMKRVSVKINKISKKAEITLRKTMNSHDVTSAVDDIFADVAGGKVLS